ncbi:MULTISPECIES: type I DNA topoisomerase [Clostridium]|jgi:DNA topoisomerase I (EC 5.99.1.2)|uniref:DNA topoisomerase 1 n=2 Tax=Clostridium beijerinckii TaxID=1520 RepID=A0AAE2UY64_CLOBE|nr:MULTISPECIES: type I DNA topoisomerase [Clostridium]ABR33368.1 DNA topoisomerase I [Clostridium beijerinckii NCIMB 8052]AIU00487.1 DNA topoisomerase I [Clostridium beijerinckii ATCC 35702]MBF7811734.1 type I DNA topoisomerase [Clostridium beijerinckii]NOW92809.1 DNA topoisomerase-1 [Clostridium beijerinckii]NRT25378.1 DNA topoisomerase-1 [Clostridium beijerinckii]
MGQKLVIVESPAKAKTIGKYLGKNYIVEASMGHVRDLPKSTLGVDIENNYTPKYITIRGKGELIDKLRKAAKKAEKVYLATDPDREGEAISWHLANILKISEDETCRIVFNEVTKTAVKASIKQARKIDLDLVDAQQARRILDRLVGYEISPILWKNVKWGLSAGRVQSAALKLICDREKEINEFIPKEYWSIDCTLKKEKKKFPVRLSTYKGKKIEIGNEETSNGIIKELNKGNFVVKSIKKGKKNRNPLPPFTTSTLQQDANRKLNFMTKRTMSIAQVLYEGVEVKNYGTVGLITYMRTDSVRISEEAQESAKEFIEGSYGKEYLPGAPRVYKGKKNIQDAHEAIRPTYVEITPEIAKENLTPEQYKLYSLIWNRFVASQMASCELNTHSIDIENGDYKFKASGSVISFDGFMKIYEYSNEEDENSVMLPELKENEELKVESLNGTQHFTQPQPRYTEASFVKLLEEKGIGRPSTYVPTISTLLGRNYVIREKKNLIPTELGEIVNNIVSEYFRQIVDVDFTADMERKLDDVEEGSENWTQIVEEFFSPLKVAIEKAEKEISKVVIEDKVSDVKCEKCGRMMVIKRGRFGEFLACPGYPECKNAKPIVEELDVPCPECGKPIVAKKSKKGKKFFGCLGYPECKFVSWYEPVKEKCPNCNSYMVAKYSKTKGNYIQCSNSECNYKEEVKKDNSKEE